MACDDDKTAAAAAVAAAAAAAPAGPAAPVPLDLEAMEDNIRISMEAKDGERDSGPDTFRGALMPHQQIGLAWLHKVAPVRMGAKGKKKKGKKDQTKKHNKSK